jgi:hypothetical protein
MIGLAGADNRQRQERKLGAWGSLGEDNYLQLTIDSCTVSASLVRRSTYLLFYSSRAF